MTNNQDNLNTGFSIDKRSARTRAIIKWMWIAFGVCVAAVLIFFILVYNGAIGYMPEIEQLKNPQDKFASTIFTADGVEMGRYFRNTGNRVYADYDEISQYVIDALISTEDERFMEHSGIDAKALGRVLVKTLAMQNKNAGGGSTITQQLAKQLYSPSSNGLLDRALQKPIEWMIAVKLERQYSKEEILKMYLNQFDFLYNAVGIKSAAQVYFGKDAKDLKIEEAAMLVGMVKNPSYYNPRRHPERTTLRRNTVLEQMEKAGKISKAELDSLSALPIVLNYHAADHKDGLAPYFREELRRYLLAKKPNRTNYPSWDQQKFTDDSILWETNELYGWVEKHPKPDGSKWDIYNDGLKIYTTIDSRMQQYAEDAVTEHMADLQQRFFNEKKNSPKAPYSSTLDQSTIETLINNAIRQSERRRVAKLAGKTDEEIIKEFNTPFEMTVFSYEGPIDTVMTPRDSILYTKHFLRTGFLSMDPRNGYVKAYVGGPNFKFFQYDMVSTGRRQVGSTIKPFLYTLAMEEGMTPCTQFLNSQPTLIDQAGRPWSPRNSGKSRIGEMVDLRWALTNSNNWISARVMDVVKPHNLVRLMHNMGITNQLPSVISLCLGPCEISVKEMVTAYSAYANYGMKVNPMFVTSIADSNGTVITSFSEPNVEVISNNAYYKILSILLNVVDGGTGNRLRRAPFNITAQMGGKTGTTNDNSDGWFMGFTPELVSGVWVGGEERNIHFNTMANGQGASMALPIYGKYMTKVYEDSTLNYSQDTKFSFPADLNLCGGTDYGVVESTVIEESMDGAFD
ncbi:MAG: transglycosylase domain-containing protein [Bacteroidales bacterium]|nr:transglycosylase domain-containing protein [Bacteroidales bacterium]